MKEYVKYAAIAVFMLAFLRGYGQIGAGVTGEITTTSVKIKNIPNSFVSTVNGDKITGYAGGLYLKLKVGPVYAKPKFLISHQSGITDVVFMDEHNGQVTISVTRLEIPVLFGLKIIGPLSVEGGPVYNRLLSATKDYGGYNIELQKTGLGYRVGANLQFSIIGLNVAYQGIKNDGSGFASYETPNQLIFGASLGF